MIIFMVIMNEYLKPWLAKKSRFPIPSELITVITGTICSYYFELGPNNNITLVGHIPVG